MAFGIAEFREFAAAFYQHPEWREELRRLVLTDEILGLPAAMRELAEAQRRTEQRVEELAEAQRELAEAQRRTEQRVEELAEAQRELAEAQRRTEQRVEELAEAQRRTEQRLDVLTERVDNLGRAVGDLQRVVGSTVEEEAASVVEVILRRKGYRILQSSYALPVGSEGEVDVVTLAEDPAGQTVWAVVEAKARLSRRDVLTWSQRMHSQDWRRRLAERGCPGPYLVYAYSIRFDLGARELAEAEGIGLLKSDGEVLAPRGLIEPADR